MYIVRGSNTFVEENANNFSSDLINGVYSVTFNPLLGFYLEKSPVPTSSQTKVYGDVHKRVDKVIKTYEDRLENKMNTGVLLVGDKGTGKTMLARKISERLSIVGIPTLIVTSTVNEDNVDQFTKFLNLIDSKVLVLFDEFEKNFNEDTQQKMLSVFDGISVNSKLFILTVNKLWDVSEFMLNRPGRIYYRFDYKGLEIPFVEEYVKEVLINEELKDETIKKIVSSFRNKFSFDMLQSVIEEMNRFDCNIFEAIKWLNIDIRNTAYKVEVYNGKKLVATDTIDNLNRFRIYWAQDNDSQISSQSDFNILFIKERSKFDSERNLYVYTTDNYTAEVSISYSDEDIRNPFLGVF